MLSRSDCHDLSGRMISCLWVLRRITECHTRSDCRPLWNSWEMPMPANLFPYLHCVVVTAILPLRYDAAVAHQLLREMRLYRLFLSSSCAILLTVPCGSRCQTGCDRSMEPSQRHYLYIKHTWRCGWINQPLTRVDDFFLMHAPNWMTRNMLC